MESMIIYFKKRVKRDRKYLADSYRLIKEHFYR